MAGTYGTPAGATLKPGFLLRPETRVLLGTGGSADLETSSWAYQVYDVHIGLGSGKGLDLGLLAALNFKTVPTIEPVAGVNYQEDTVYEVTGEDCEVTLTLFEIKPQVLGQALATGRLRILSEDTTQEVLMTFGGGCEITDYPLVIEFTNAGCEAPSTQNIGAGITGGILTLYKVIQTSGLDLGALTAKANTQVPITFKALADTTKAKRNRLGCLYLY